MLFSAKRTTVFFVSVLIGFSLTAQKKELTDEQYFKNNLRGIVESLPVVTKWIDDTHFILLREGKRYSVDARSGSETEMSDTMRMMPSASPVAYARDSALYLKINGEEILLSSEKEKRSNPTVSPDGNYVAFTKKNDLYTIQVATKKETRLTTDGSNVILNGYASWVYMEEILGRSSQYRAFWWSPDSRRIAFFRSDDSKVPVFTITNSKGLHGEVETTHYPKVGDPNPVIKVGIIKPDGGDVVWTKINKQDDQYFGAPFWKPDGSALLVQWMPRSQDELRIYAVDTATGDLNTFYTEKQKPGSN